MIVILVGKSCSGKDSIRKELEKIGYNNIVSYTTRDRRGGEINGVDYWFVNNKEFNKMINDGKLLEYRIYDTVFGEWFYGVGYEEINKVIGKKDGVLILELKGAKKFIEHYGKNNCCVVYVKSSKEIREQRAKKRGSFSEAEWNRRLKTDDIDFSNENLENCIDFSILNNKDNDNDLKLFAKFINNVVRKREKVLTNK